DKKDGMRIKVWVEEWKWDGGEEDVGVVKWGQRESAKGKSEREENRKVE
ncbi:6409_t:CDS:1, partial [Dentiscutata erythropus]